MPRRGGWGHRQGVHSGNQIAWHKKSEPGGSTPEQERETLTKEDGPLANARFKASAAQTMRHDALVQSSTNPGENLWVPSTALQKSYANPTMTRINSDQIPSSAFTGTGVFFDCVLNGAEYVTYCDHIILELILLNTDATLPIVIGPFHQLFDKIEILFNNGTVQDTLYPENLYLNYFSDLSDEKRSIMARNYGWNRQTDRDSTLRANELTNYDAETNGTGIVIPPSESRTLYCEIPCHLKYMNVYLPSLKKDGGPRIRLYPSRDNCMFSTSIAPTYSNTPPTIQQAQLVLLGPQLSPAVQKSITANYAANPVVTPGIGHDRQTTSIALTNGVESAEIPLTSTIGQVAAFYMIISETGVYQQNVFSPAANQTWREFDRITFNDGSGRAWGYAQEPMQLYNTYVWSNHFCSNLALEKFFLFFPFCKSITDDIMHGANTGSYRFTSKETIRFFPQSVTGNTFVDGTSHTVTFYILRHAMSRQVGGIINFYKV